MTPRFIVADAGPLIALAVGNILSDSVAMLGGLLVPQIVLDECLEDPSAAGASIIKALASAGPPQVAFTVIPNSDITPLDEALARGLGLTSSPAERAYLQRRLAEAGYPGFFSNGAEMNKSTLSPTIGTYFDTPKSLRLSDPVASKPTV